MSEQRSKINQDALNNMRLHERFWLNDIQKDVLRVQSGWIYSDYDDEKGVLFNSIYIPKIK